MPLQRVDETDKGDKAARRRGGGESGRRGDEADGKNKSKSRQKQVATGRASK